MGARHDRPSQGPGVAGSRIDDGPRGEVPLRLVSRLQGTTYWRPCRPPPFSSVLPRPGLGPHATAGPKKDPPPPVSLFPSCFFPFFFIHQSAAPLSLFAPRAPVAHLPTVPPRTPRITLPSLAPLRPPANKPSSSHLGCTCPSAPPQLRKLCAFLL
ncbi:hypothetical protein CTA1_11957 [Colletotrichum tanaceti]|uniref:Uncharacterized protein n=1 Tax=Colletotrichum tanaceti TaxID=1306861 RepID=A0A4U6X154_9PEZI|nr:hypothetical protein CTA1_11957 [Colletotrichum tanaceti]